MVDIVVPFGVNDENVMFVTLEGRSKNSSSSPPNSNSDPDIYYFNHNLR